MTDQIRKDLCASLERSIAQLLGNWSQTVCSETSQVEIYLAARTLDTYLQELLLFQCESDLTLFPIGFEGYAFCVEALLHACTDLRQVAGTVTISTLLTVPLTTWYNISMGAVKFDGNIMFTRMRWEDYKKRVRALRSPTTGKSNHAIQMRRILTPNTFMQDEKKKTLYVYNTHDGYAEKIETLRKMSIPDCIELLEPVGNARDHANVDDYLHLLATHKDAQHDCNKHAGWTPILEHFCNTYHNAVHEAGQQIPNYQKGVFCGFVETESPLKQNEDIFLVDLRGCNHGLFGIAFKHDHYQKSSGLVFLPDEQVIAWLARFDALWQEAGQKKVRESLRTIA